MPIETSCRECGRRLRVPDHLSGRKARCPACNTIYTVTGEALPLSNQWRLRTEEGTTYGPVSKEELDAWVREGRVSAQCELQREGTDHWLKATQCYAGLKELAYERPAFAPPSSTASSRRGVNPFAATTASARVFRPPMRPHQGGTILVLGIVGLLCCQVLSPLVWIMARSDLRAMNEGRMDERGRWMTAAGLALGVLGTIPLMICVLSIVVTAIANL